MEHILVCFFPREDDTVAHESTVGCRLYLKEGCMFFSRSCSEALVFEFRSSTKLLCLITGCLDTCDRLGPRFNHNSSTGNRFRRGEGDHLQVLFSNPRCPKK